MEEFGNSQLKLILSYNKLKYQEDLEKSIKNFNDSIKNIDINQENIDKKFENIYFEINDQVVQDLTKDLNYSKNLDNKLEILQINITEQEKVLLALKKTLLDTKTSLIPEKNPQDLSNIKQEITTIQKDLLSTANFGKLEKEAISKNEEEIKKILAKKKGSLLANIEKIESDEEGGNLVEEKKTGSEEKIKELRAEIKFKQEYIELFNKQTLELTDNLQKAQENKIEHERQAKQIEEGKKNKKKEPEDIKDRIGNINVDNLLLNNKTDKNF